MSVWCGLREEASGEPLIGGCCVRTSASSSGSGIQTDSSISELSKENINTRALRSCCPSALELFLHGAPLRCVEAVARCLDVCSFLNLLSLNSSLLSLCYTPALLPCWTHFALHQRILRHGENVLLPLVSPTCSPRLTSSSSSSSSSSSGGGGGRKGAQEETGQVSSWQTFNRRLPQVSRPDLLRIGSLNWNWRSRRFATEQRHIVPFSEALDKAFVLPAPPLVSSCSSYTVAPDAPLSLQPWPSVGRPASFQVRGGSHQFCGAAAEGSPLLLVLPSGRVFVVHAAAAAAAATAPPRALPRLSCVEAKLPVLPLTIPRNAAPLIQFGAFAPKGWLLGEDDLSPQQQRQQQQQAQSFAAAAAAAAAGASVGGPSSGPRLPQSQRRRQQRQQRQGQQHRLHVSWAHVSPHPLYPCPGDSLREEGPQRGTPSADSSLGLFPGASAAAAAAAAAAASSSKLPPFPPRSSSSQPSQGNNTGLGHCPQVRLLSLCLPPIKIEMPPLPPCSASSQLAHAAQQPSASSAAPAEAGAADAAAAADAEDRGSEALMGDDSTCCKGTAVADTLEGASNGVISPSGAAAGVPAAATGVPAAAAAACAPAAAQGLPPAAGNAAAGAASTSSAAAGADGGPPTPQRVWPVALCSFSAKGSRFQAHAIVCCVLREEEMVKAARCRLWYKKKRQTAAQQRGAAPGGAGELLLPAEGQTGEEEQQQNSDLCGDCPSAATVGLQQQLQKDCVTPTSSSSSTSSSSTSRSAKAISFSLQQLPLAVFVGLVAVGTSHGRILCTPPPRCLVRRCYCCGSCLATIRGKTTPVGPTTTTAAAAAASQAEGSGETGQQQADKLKTAGGLSSRNSSGSSSSSNNGLTNSNGSNSSSSSSSSCSSSNSSSSSRISCPTVTAARAARGVSFMEVGTFGADSGAVDYVELVRGTPWAPRSAAQQQPELLVSTQQRDFSWHWTRAPTSAAHTQGPPMLQRGAAGSSEGRPCGGVEAEALWLFACSKEAGIKVFRFVWSIEEASGCGGGTETGKDSSCKETGRSAGDRQGLLGRWCCALTIRGRCQLVSLDLNNGIVAVCTPRDSRVCFVCFSHLLPAHICVSPSGESPVLAAEDLSKFGRYGLPRPQHVPLGGYLPVQQQQFAAMLLSPAECARLELLVARRPSFLQPLGGRRWVVVDGSVIRVVQMKIREATPSQRKATSAAEEERMHATLMGSPLDQLRQLRRPVVEQPELPWCMRPPAPPELQSMRLCVFSHPRSVYQCAFDGVRRLVTIDLQEVLMVWDLQRYTKLFEVDLMARGDRHTAALSDSQEDDEYGIINRERICRNKDQLETDSEHEPVGRSLARRGPHSNGDLAGSCSSKGARKAGKMSLKKQFGTGWMQRQLLAHTKTGKHHTAHASPIAITRPAETQGSRSREQQGNGALVGGLWLNASSLEPAMQLQLLYDAQKEADTHARATGTHTDTPVTHKDQQQDQQQVEAEESRGDSPEAAEAKVPLLDSSDDGRPVPRVNGASLVAGGSSGELAKEHEQPVVGPPGESTEGEVDPELAAAVAVCYADEFPPLASPFSLEVCMNGRKKDSPTPSSIRPSPLQSKRQTANPSVCKSSPTGALSTTAPDAQPSEENAAAAVGDPGDSTAASRHRVVPCSKQSLSAEEQPKQRPLGLEPPKSTGGADSSRPSFAAVVAAGAPSGGAACPRTGWASGPTDVSFLVSLVGEEGARALREMAAAMGMTAEELYIHQMEQWEELQQRSCATTHACGRSGGQNSEKRAAGFTNASAEDASPSDLPSGTQLLQLPSPLPSAATAQDKQQQPAGETLCPASDVDSSRASHISGSPAVTAMASSIQGPPADRFEPSLTASPRLHPLPGPMVHNGGSHTDSRMVGLLGRQRYIAQLGPNAQQRHVAAVCVSETCLALLFKNLKTWQIWTFAPNGSTTARASEAMTEWNS